MVSRCRLKKVIFSPQQKMFGDSGVLVSASSSFDHCERRKALSVIPENSQTSLSSVFSSKTFYKRKKSLWKLLTVYSRVTVSEKRCYFWVFGQDSSTTIKGRQCQSVGLKLWLQYLDYWTDCRETFVQTFVVLNQLSVNNPLTKQNIHLFPSS